MAVIAIAHQVIGNRSLNPGFRSKSELRCYRTQVRRTGCRELGGLALSWRHVAGPPGGTVPLAISGAGSLCGLRD